MRDPDTTPPPGEQKRPPTGTFTIGAGYASDDGFIGMAQVRQDDLFHTGQKLSLTALVSAHRQLFDLDYGIPLSTRQEVHFQLFDHEQRLPAFDRSTAGGGVSILTPITAHLRSFVGYQVEDIGAELHGPTDIAARATQPAADNRGGRLASLRGGFVYSTLDNGDAPTRGLELGVASSVANAYTGSAIDLSRLDFWGGFHHAAGPFIVHLSGSLSTEQTTDGTAVPLAERLVLDRASIVRGFAPGSIGPTYGGDTMYTARAELELPLFRKAGISAVGFVDQAGVFDTAGGGAGGAGTSAGFGILWRSLIGPLRFDWAFVPGEKKPVFIFGIGQTF